MASRPIARDLAVTSNATDSAGRTSVRGLLPALLQGGRLQGAPSRRVSLQGSCSIARFAV